MEHKTSVTRFKTVVLCVDVCACMFKGMSFITQDIIQYLCHSNITVFFSLRYHFLFLPPLRLVQDCSLQFDVACSPYPIMYVRQRVDSKPTPFHCICEKRDCNIFSQLE